MNLVARVDGSGGERDVNAFPVPHVPTEITLGSALYDHLSYFYVPPPRIGFYL